MIDAKGYAYAGENVYDLASREQTPYPCPHQRSQLKARTRANTRHTVNAIALFRNPKSVREALASPEYSKWIETIHAEMSSLIDKHTFEVCHQTGAQDKNRQRWPT